MFQSRTGQPMTRFGVHDIVTRYARLAGVHCAELREKRVGPHIIRHTTATHLLRAGVDINTIRAWLGTRFDRHNQYLPESDLAMKAKALAMCDAPSRRNGKRWRDNPDLLAFLAQLKGRSHPQTHVTLRPLRPRLWTGVKN